MKEKNTLVTRDLKISFLRSQNQIVEDYFFLKNFITSEGVVSDNVIFYQPLPITRYQVRFYAYNYFE